MTDEKDDHPSSEDKKIAKSETDPRSEGVVDTGQPEKPSFDLAANWDRPVLVDEGVLKLIEESGGKGHVLPFETLVQGHIGRQLRALYDDVLAQPIPDRLLDLHQQLDRDQDGPEGSKGE